MLRETILITALALGVTATPVRAQSQCEIVQEVSLHACTYVGDGPTIVLAAGAGQDSRTWTPIIEELRTIGSVVAFDRPGLGRSPGVPGPRTPTVIAGEIGDLISALGVSEPLILVGHSMGGVHLIRYAEMLPQRVAGLILLDTPPPDFEQERMNLLSEAEREQRNRDLAAGRSRAPEMVGRERDGAAAEPWHFGGFPEETPLIVVAADTQFFGDLGSQTAHRRLWLRLSRRWLDLSTRSEFVVARGSSHAVHRDRPELVVELVKRLAGGMRSIGGA